MDHNAFQRLAEVFCLEYAMEYRLELERSLAAMAARPMPTEQDLLRRDRALFMAETENGNWDD